MTTALLAARDEKAGLGMLFGMCAPYPVRPTIRPLAAETYISQEFESYTNT